MMKVWSPVDPWLHVCQQGPPQSRLVKELAEELAAPYFLFKEAGCSVTVSSTKGGGVPVNWIVQLRT
eukprot:scaffold168046_cov19-Tisochrysis_lutea.AAC.2